MANLFLSHSSTDKPFVRQLAGDLMVKGHEVWLDEWEIKVGHSIPLKIEHGLSGADFVVLVLSEHAVQSAWVEREWHAKYWDQLSSRKECVLPCLLEKCDIPKLLNGIKYANFVKSYSGGLCELLDGIAPVVGKPSLNIDPQATVVAALLTKLHAGVLPLSACLAEGLTVARILNSSSLDEFCRIELGEPFEPESTTPRRPWRVVEAYIMIGELNPLYWEFTTEQGLFDYLIGNPQAVTPIRMVFNWSVQQIEEQVKRLGPTSTAIKLAKKLGDFETSPKNPDTLVTAYMRPHSSSKVLSSIRDEFCKRLLEHLPAIQALRQ